MSQAIKNVKSCFDVTFALAESVLSKLCQELPKMQRSITESMLPAWKVWIPYQIMQITARMKIKKYEPYMPMTERIRTGLEAISE